MPQPPLPPEEERASRRGDSAEAGKKTGSPAIAAYDREEYILRSWFVVACSERDYSSNLARIELACSSHFSFISTSLASKVSSIFARLGSP